MLVFVKRLERSSYEFADAEAVFDISYFRNNPLPFYTLAHELYPGKYRPTLSHSFIRLLSDKGLLLKLFTQNIDCLDREAGVPADRIVEAHGSFARQRCIECKKSYPEDLMRQAVSRRDVPHCITSQCNGLVKPDIVFFGEQLPEEFHRNRTLPHDADLCIIMGTSLTVQPFASLPGFCSEGVPRVLINLERVGDLGSRADDVLILGDCDAGVRKLASALGWEDELQALYNKSGLPPITDSQGGKAPESKTKDEKLEDQIAGLTEEVDKSLRIFNAHTNLLKEHLSKDEGRCADKIEAPNVVDTLADGQIGKATHDTAKRATSDAKEPLPASIEDQLNAHHGANVPTDSHGVTAITKEPSS